MDRSTVWRALASHSRTRAALLLGAVVMTLGATPGTAGSDGACEFWVAPAPAGDDAAPGTAAEPWATLDHAAAVVPDRGCSVSFAPGTYRGASGLKRRFARPTTFRAAVTYQAVLEHTGTVVDIDGGRNIVLEGFELRHSGAETAGYVAIVDRRDHTWSEHITFRNNIFHDSYGDDLLKLHNGVRFATVEGNVFYNQGDNEQHIDVNSVTDITIQDNVFFNDFEASGRVNTRTTKHYVVVKDSNEGVDGLEGSERVTIRRNVLLHWQGGPETLIKVGNDGKPYHEASDVVVENNLIIGNGTDLADAAFGVRGAKDVIFVNNTVVGDLPAKMYAYRIHRKGANPLNENITFVNNIWSDPTATMGSEIPGRAPHLAKSNPSETVGLVHDHNLYWNGGEPIPPGREISPASHDTHRVVADPRLPEDQSHADLPRWTGDGFPSGATTIREEFLRLVEAYGGLPASSPAADAADPRLASDDDIRGRRRHRPDIGAYEAGGDAPGIATGAPRRRVVPVLWSVPALLVLLLALRRRGGAAPPAPGPVVHLPAKDRRGQL